MKIYIYWWKHSLPRASFPNRSEEPALDKGKLDKQINYIVQAKIINFHGSLPF